MNGLNTISRTRKGHAYSIDRVKGKVYTMSGSFDYLNKFDYEIDMYVDCFEESFHHPKAAKNWDLIYTECRERRSNKVY